MLRSLAWIVIVSLPAVAGAAPGLALPAAVAIETDPPNVVLADGVGSATARVTYCVFTPGAAFGPTTVTVAAAAAPAGLAVTVVPAAFSAHPRPDAAPAQHACAPPQVVEVSFSADDAYRSGYVTFVAEAEPNGMNAGSEGSTTMQVTSEQDTAIGVAGLLALLVAALGWRLRR